MASCSDYQSVVYNKNFDVMWSVNKYFYHELTVTPDDNVLLPSDELFPINKIMYNSMIFYALILPGKNYSNGAYTINICIC